MTSLKNTVHLPRSCFIAKKQATSSAAGLYKKTVPEKVNIKKYLVCTTI